MQKIARQNFGIFEEGDGKEKSLPPIFSHVGGPGAPNFFLFRGLVGPYLVSKYDVFPIQNWG